MANRTIRVATDVGGTFTDLVCFETDHGTGQSRIVTAKSDTTPPDFEQGVLNVLEKGGVDPKVVDFLAHGTTVVINALTERKGVKVGADHHRGLSRHAGDRARQPARLLQPALREAASPSCRAISAASCPGASPTRARS